MDSLPSELIIKIMGYMKIRDLLSILLLNHKFNGLIKEEAIWKKFVMDDFGQVDKINDNYYLTYRHYKKYTQVYLLTKYDGYYKGFIDIYNTLELAKKEIIRDIQDHTN